MKLHLGAGRTPLEGWVNLDLHAGPGIEVVADLSKCRETRLPFDDNSVDEFVGRHVLEHIQDTLGLMEELHRIAKPGAKATFFVPYGSSDDAYEDPTHIRQFFLKSFGYFSQPYYWRADYGYRGDWQNERIDLKVRKADFEGQTPDQVLKAINTHRNIVLEMAVYLKAIKPIRAADSALIQSPEIQIFRA